jgi:uncharacterized protein YcsI (UPF0317 family)
VAGDRLEIVTPGGGNANLTLAALRTLSPQSAWRLTREQRHIGPTAGWCAGWEQANLVIVPPDAATDFENFCRANPQAMPLLERFPVDVSPRCAPGAAICTDLPAYRICTRDGTRKLFNVSGWVAQGSVAFLLGCSFTFESELEAAGIPIAHLRQNRNVSMYASTLQTVPAGIFCGPVVVSMRPIAPADESRVREICRRFPNSHGEPIHIGDPAAIGIQDLSRPDYGDAVDIPAGTVPFFWACGVTPQEAIRGALDAGHLDWAVVHEPGCMFITARRAT